MVRGDSHTRKKGRRWGRGSKEGERRVRCFLKVSAPWGFCKNLRKLFNSGAQRRKANGIVFGICGRRAREGRYV